MQLCAKLIFMRTTTKKLIGVFAVEEGFAPPPQRFNGLGCVPEGEMVTYTCTVSDPPPTGFTDWRGSNFECPNQSPPESALLRHSLYSTGGTSIACNNGAVFAHSIAESENNYTSAVIMNVSRSFNGLMISCSLVGVTTVGSDTLKVGGKLPSTVFVHFESFR